MADELNNKELADLVKSLKNTVAEVLSYCKSNESKLYSLHSEHEKLLSLLQSKSNGGNFNTGGIQIKLTPTQIKALADDGLQVEQIMAITGYTYQEVMKKYNS